MSDLHDLIREEMEGKGPSARLDNLLNACPDMECGECARIICPYSDDMHFHHDGCPACSSAEENGEDMDTAEATAREAIAQFAQMPEEFSFDPPDVDEAQEWHDFDPDC